MVDHKTVGHMEYIRLPEVTNRAVKARVDTGAKTSAIWTSSVEVKEDGLYVTFFDKASPYYSGQPIIFKHYRKTNIINSTGSSQKRYKVRMLVVVGKKRIRASFTLADRSKQTYPVLIGRNVLRGKFIVDVSHKGKNSYAKPINKSKVVKGLNQ